MHIEHCLITDIALGISLSVGPKVLVNNTSMRHHGLPILALNIDIQSMSDACLTIFLRQIFKLVFHCLNAIVFIWAIRLVLKIAFLTNFNKISANFLMSLFLVQKDPLAASYGARMLLELALFLMLDGFLICHAKGQYLLHVHLPLDLVVLVKFAAIHQTEKLSGHELIFHISMKVLILWILALHWTLERLLLLPVVDAIHAEGGLASGTLLGVQKHFEADAALEVGFILL